jgi:hypothetical protein
MSNVLIGIIGVILFIGLALAGALFLGPRFQEATVNAKAASVHQALSQMTNAANMYQTQEGKALRANNYTTNMQTLVDSRYIKSRISYNGSEAVTVDKDGHGRDMPVDHIQLIIGPQSDLQAKSICREIERQFGSTDPDATIAAVTTTDGWGARVAQRRAGGCFLYTGGAASGSYYSYMAI